MLIIIKSHTQMVWLKTEVNLFHDKIFFLWSLQVNLLN